MITTLTLTIGLPASGKSTWARDERDRMRCAGFECETISRDDLRQEIWRHVWRPGTPMLPDWKEARVTRAQHIRIRNWIGHGTHVIVDDTNLRKQWRDDLAKIAAQTGAGLIVKDFRHVPVDVCVQRDRMRSYQNKPSVGEDVIRHLAKIYLEA